MEIVCPGCSARFQVPESVRTFTCPYCGLVFGERVVEDHYYFPVIKEEPYTMLLNFLRRQFGIPSDIVSNSTLKTKYLYYVPVYFYYLYGRMIGRCGGRGWTESEEAAYKGLVASRNFRDIFEDYPFPVRGKKFFRKEIMNIGFYQQPEFPEDEARNYVKAYLHKILEDELFRECKNLKEVSVEELRVDFRGLIHYPIYYLEYLYDDQTYSAYLDGVDGKIISAEYPIKLQTKTLQMIIGSLLLTCSIVFGLALSLIVGNPLPFIFSIVPAISSSTPLLTRSLTKKVISSEVKIIQEESRPFTKYLKKFLT